MSSPDKTDLVTKIGAGIALISLSLFCFYLSDIFNAFITAFIIAYILNPIVIFLEKFYIPRFISAGLFLVAFFFLCIVVVILLIPVIQNQIHVCADIFNTQHAAIANFLEEHVRKISHALKWPHPQNAGHILPHVAQQDITLISNFLIGLIGSGLNLANFIILAPVLAFFFIIDWTSLSEGALSWVPLSHRLTARRITTDIRQSMTDYLQGQFLISSLLTLYYCLCLALIIRLPSFLAIGAVIFFLTFIPYLGFFAHMTIVTLSVMGTYGTQTPWLSLIIVYAVGMILDSLILSPYLMTRFIRLSPLWICTALAVAMHFTGLKGTILAMPAALVIRVLGDYVAQAYRRSFFYRGTADEPIDVAFSKVLS